MPAAAIVLDLEELSNLTMNDRKLMREILDALVADADRHATLLEAAARECNLSHISKFARAATRACANVGAYAAAEAFRAVERRAAQRASNGWSPLLEGVRVEIGRLRAEAPRI